MKSEGSMTTKTRRQYTEEFKAEAVRLVQDSARPVAHVARDLGIADHLLYRWRAEQQEAERWLRLFGQFLVVHKWHLAVCAYAAVGRAGRLSQYTRSGVRPSRARCGLISL